jgi:hypothetical protein
MKKIITLIVIITLFTSCSSDEKPSLTIDEVAAKTELSFKSANLDIGLITVSGSLFSVITNNSSVDFKVRNLKVYEENGEIRYTKDYNDDFISVPKNGGEWLDGKNFNYALMPLVFEWTIAYNGQTKVLKHTFKKN